MKEWNDQFNPFNSMKVLKWYKHLEACANGHYLTPVCASIDPTNKCNFDCVFCNSFGVVDEGKETMTEEHLINIADFLGEWGKDTQEGHIKGVYVTGGGEPLMNPNTMSLVERLTKNDIQSAIITNGAFINDEIIDIVASNCRWIGISVDAVTNKTYNAMKGLPDKAKILDKVVENIRKLVQASEKYGSKCDVGFKFLLHPYNIEEIYDAAIFARSLGVKDFHLRPVRYLNFEKIKEGTVNFSDRLVEINEQFEKVQTLNTDRFHVYGVRHKFNTDLSIKKNFSKCRAVPLEPTFAADGNVYLCFDHRGEDSMVLCKHSPDVTDISKVWNTDLHKSMMDSINVDKCPSCTFSSYNEAIEKVVLKDNMCANFL
jgi:MoaA/NifB/PqqE/SkfB family radical SAM enzyme